ncbi:MAG: hypothetical protein H8E01_00355, partial [Chloroflexi bacterium]|nr:hypothetical protein [Chloroflexota bacterium]
MPLPTASGALSSQGMTALSYSPVVTVSVTDDYVWGFTTPNRNVFLTLRTGVTTKGAGLGWSDDVGYFFGSFYDAGLPVGVEPGDSVDVTVDGVTTTIEVVNITGAVNPAADTVSGTGPINNHVSVFIWPNYSVGTTTGPLGNYSADFSGLVDIQAADWAEVSYQNDNGDWISYDFGAQGPFVVGETYNEVFGYAAPDQEVDIVIADADGSPKASTTITADSNDGFYWYYPDPDIVAGDRVTVTIGGVANATVVADLTVGADLDTEIVSGTGPASEQLMAHLYDRVANGWDLHQQTVTTDAGGAYTANYSIMADIRRYDWVAVFHADAAGNETVIWRHPPLLSVNETYNNVWGYAPPGSEVTLTLRTGGTVKETVTATADDSNGYLRADFSEDVVPGDDVDASGGLVATVHVPNGALTALANVGTDTVSGTAPASSDLWVRGWYSGRGYYRSFEDYVISAGDETYQDDLSGRYDLYNGYEGHVYYSQVDDHKVFVHYHAPMAHVNTTHDELWGYAPEAGASVSVTVTNGGGVKATTTVDASNTDGYFEAFYDGGVDIAPGDTVEVSTNPWNDVIGIQDIQITVDPDTAIVSGTGPANETMVVEAWGDGYGYAAVPSDGSGNYVADLSGEVELGDGDRVRVGYFNDDGNEVYGYYFTPYVRANQSHEWVDGQTPYPHADVELLLWDGGEDLKGTGFNHSDDNGWFNTTNVYTTGAQVNIEVGDVLEARIAGESPIFVEVVPMQGDVNATAETVWGNVAAVPEGSLVRVEMWGGPGGSRATTTDAAGDFAVDFSLDDIRDGYYMGIWYVRPDGNQVGIVRSPLHLGINLINDHFWGETSPGLPVTLTLRADDGTPKAEIFATADAEGRMSDNFGADVVSGDTVEAEGADGRFTSVYVENLSAAGDASDDAVYGVAPPSAHLNVNVSGHGEGANRDTWSDDDGWWEVYFGDIFDIQVDDQGWVIYMNEDGHQIQASFTVEPFIQVHMRNYDWVQGRVAPNAWVDITLRDNLGVVKGTYDDWSRGDGWFGSWCILDDDGHCVDIAPGDTVEVVYDGSDPIIVPVIEITGIVDSAANTISGQVLADDLPTDAWTDIWWTREGAGQSFTTDEFGNYLVDYNPYDVLPGHWVNIWYTNPDGHQLGAIFSELRLDVHVSHDDVDGIAEPGRTVAMTLRAPDGSVKDEATDIANYEGQFGAVFSEDIAPGDTVEATTNPETSVYIEDVTIDVDVDADTVCGTAPPDAWLQVGIHGGPWWELAADEFGDYCADFSHEYDIGPGDEGEVHYESPEGHRLYYSFFVPYEPYVEVHQTHNWVAGRTAWPNSWVDITLRDSLGEVKGSYSDWSDGDGWFGG